VNENTLYRVRADAADGAAAAGTDAAADTIRLGSELIAGIELTAGDWEIERAAIKDGR
jgi:hypothetical protein